MCVLILQNLFVHDTILFLILNMAAQFLKTPATCGWSNTQDSILTLSTTTVAVLHIFVMALVGEFVETSLVIFCDDFLFSPDLYT